MGNLSDLFKQDIRFKEALKACMNCGICTAICPAAEFFPYDPRSICDIVQRDDEETIEKLLRSDTIWYCGQCMSCKTRCPRGNVPGEVINVLRKISQELGYNNDCPEGRKQKEIMQGVGANILKIGYCVHPDTVDPKMHPEQGPIWAWYVEHIKDIAPRLGANYNGDGPGALRKIRQENLDEIRKIFEVTGGMDLREKVMNDKE